MTEPVWLDKEAVLLLHGVSVARFGGAPGIRDEGLLEGALARPVNRFLYGQTADLAELAAAYAFGIVKAHGFVDGNKRAAFLACGVFLDLTGKRLVATAPDAIRAVIALADSTIGEPEFAAWIRLNWE